MAKKNLSADRSGKVVSATSTAGVASNTENEPAPEKQLTEEEKREQFEKYKPTGEFEKDFLDLCSLVGLSSLVVTARPKRPPTPSLSPPDTGMSKGDKKSSGNQTQVVETVKPADAEDLPTTYTIADNIYNYLKPRVEIETEEDGNKAHVKELFVRGWQVDERVIEILTVTMPELDHLVVVDLWNAGLNDDTLLSLGHCLSASTSLKTIRLDGNSHTKEQRFDIFITEKSIIQNISLKNCALVDTAALHIGTALLENKNLLTLNLCFNNLTDVGVAHLANGLRMNRTLLSLNLGSNKISDEGATRLAEAISTFALTHEQVVARRMLKSSLTHDDNSLSPTHSATQDRPPTASRSFSKDDKKHRDKGNNKKKELSSNKLKEISVKRGPSNADTSKAQKNQKNKVSIKQDRNKTPQQEVEGSYEFKHPLLEKVHEIKGELWVPGNRSLINLNLARNQIGEVGLNMIYTAIKYQIDLANENNRTTGTGLMRLSLLKNLFPLEHPSYVQLLEMMKMRDPFYKPPTPAPIEESKKEEN